MNELLADHRRASKSSGARSATTARRQEAEVEARTCVSDLARYIKFLREEERLVGRPLGRLA